MVQNTPRMLKNSLHYCHKYGAIIQSQWWEKSFSSRILLINVKRGKQCGIYKVDCVKIRKFCGKGFSDLKQSTDRFSVRRNKCRRYYKYEDNLRQIANSRRILFKKFFVFLIIYTELLNLSVDKLELHGKNIATWWKKLKLFKNEQCVKDPIAD